MALLQYTLFLFLVLLSHVGVRAANPPVIHYIYATDDGFRPNITNANPGDVLEFHFLVHNHSVVMGDFQEPCEPAQTGGFSSGFLPAADGENPNIFSVTINDTSPLVFYCSQSNHCASGMVGVVNAEESALELYACDASKRESSAVSPLYPYGGVLSSRVSDTAAPATPAATVSVATPGTPAPGAGTPSTSASISVNPGSETTPGSPLGGGPNPYGSATATPKGSASGSGSSTASAPSTSGPGIPTGSPTTDDAAGPGGDAARVRMIAMVGVAVIGMF